jgi:ribonuclease Y
MLNIVYLIILPLGGVIIGWLIRWLYARNQLTSSEQKALRLKETAVAEAENAKKAVLLEAQDKILEERRQFEREVREQRSEIQRYEKRIQQKEDNLDRKTSDLDRRQAGLNQRLEEVDERDKKLTEEEQRCQTELERISGFTAEEAKKILMQNLENEAKHDAQVLINKIEQEAQASADKKARDILITTIQRLATEVTTEITVTSVSLPNDEMKGRIIGREGRNIRTLETLTGWISLLMILLKPWLSPVSTPSEKRLPKRRWRD